MARQTIWAAERSNRRAISTSAMDTGPEPRAMPYWVEAKRAISARWCDRRMLLGEVTSAGRELAQLVEPKIVHFEVAWVSCLAEHQRAQFVACATLTGRLSMPTRDGASPRRGEVWLAQLDKVRPVIILTRNPMGAYLNALLAVPITRTERGLGSEVRVGPEDGIRVASVANQDNLALVRQERLLRRVGRARPTTLVAICQALAFTVDCSAA